MSNNPLKRWHQLVRERDARGIDELLADEVIFHSPVVHTPQVGKALTRMYLMAAVQVLANPTFRYVREVVEGRDAMLEFEVQIDNVKLNGVDMIRWNDEGQIVDFKVMVRPLKAIQMLQEKMAALLQAIAAKPAP